MASLVFSEGAIDDLERLADFVAATDTEASAATGPLILQALAILETHPLVGAKIAGDLRELVISRGRTGYIALYLHEADADRVIVHAIRHQREAGFEE